MPNFQINYQPRMTQSLVSQRVFEAEPVVIVQVGARFGIESCWEVFDDQLKVIAFEIDKEECERLNECGDSRVRYLPFAIGGRREERTFHSYGTSSAGSLHRHNENYWNRRVGSAALKLTAEQLITTVSLGQVLEQESESAVDFMQLDAEGCELEILAGATGHLENQALFGIISEVHFQPDMFLESQGRRSATYCEIDAYLGKFGFELYELDVYRFTRAALPQPFLYHSKDESGNFQEAATVSGQVTHGDALFFRDPLKNEAESKLTNILKQAAFFEIYGLPDCAAELLLARRSLLQSEVDVDVLLDCLVPDIKGERADYLEHMQNYRADPSRFYPRDGRRYPEPIVSHYDGEFTPSWQQGREVLEEQAPEWKKQEDHQEEVTRGRLFSWLTGKFKKSAA